MFFLRNYKARDGQGTGQSHDFLSRSRLSRSEHLGARYKIFEKNRCLYSNVKNLIISLFPKYSLKKIKFSGPFRSTETFGTKIILLNSLTTRFKKIWVYNYATFVAYSPAKIVSIKRNPSICNFLTQPCFAEPRSARD